MENILILVLLGVAYVATGGILWFVLDQRYGNKLSEARRQLREQSEADFKKRWQAERERLDTEQAEIKQQQQNLEQERSQFDSEIQAQQVLRAQLEAEQTALNQAREQLAGLSPEAAREELFKRLRTDLATEVSLELRDHEQQLKARRDELSQEVLTRAVQRVAVNHAREQMAFCLDLPDTSWRGRVIGKEGRTVQALQAATGADFSLDDESPSVWISSFDPWRRELARRTLTSLIENNRLHPARIDEEVKRQEKALNAELPRLGEDAAVRAGVHGLPPEILLTLGKLHYRRSFGQDVLNHAVEVALLAAELARQLHADVEIARRGGLLHDLGKALTGAESTESHTQLGVQLARRCGESEAVLHAIAAHHGEEEPTSVEAVLVQIADTLSAARPGARSEQLAKHVQRLGQFEKIALGFTGVTRAWVLRAGKEVRVMVDPDEVPENRVRPLASEIARAISQEMQGPQQVKVAVIREIQATDYAR